jgi:hypothetical protein
MVGEVRWVGAVGQRLVIREVGPGPTDVEPLVDPHLQQERAPQEDRLPTRRPRHCRTQPLVGSCQNSAAAADLGHLLEGCVGDPLSSGDHAPRHGVFR